MVAFIAFYILSATDTGFINIVSSRYPDARRLLKMKGMLDLQTYHTFPPIVPCTVPAWGLPGRRRMSKPGGASASCQRSLTPRFAPTDTSVDCPEPAENHQGERPEIKADESAPTCERKHGTDIQQCHIRPTPWCGSRQCWIAYFWGSHAVLYCSRLPDVSWFWAGAQLCHTCSEWFNLLNDSINDWEKIKINRRN